MIKLIAPLVLLALVAGALYGAYNLGYRDGVASVPSTTPGLTRRPEGPWPVGTLVRDKLEGHLGIISNYVSPERAYVRFSDRTIAPGTRVLDEDRSGEFCVGLLIDVAELDRVAGRR